MQITPPAARPPASIPAKPRNRSAAVQSPAAEAAAEEIDRRRSRAQSAPAVRACRPSTPTRLRARKPLRQRPSPRRKSPRPSLTKQDGVAAAARARAARRRCLRRLSARLLSRGVQGGHAPRERTGRSGRDDAARRSLRQRLRRREGREEGARLVLARGRSRRPPGDLRARDVRALPAAADRRTRPRLRRCSTRPPSSATSPPPTIWRCSISRDSRCARTSRAPPSCCARRPMPAARRRNTRSRRSTRKATASPKDPVAAAKLLGAAARSGNEAAEVEYAIALFNGTGIAKDENAAAALFRKAALQGQCGGAEPARAHPGDRPRPAGRSGRGHEVAHHRQGRRRLRHLAGKLHAAASRTTSARPARTPRGSGSRTPSRIPEFVFVAWPRGDFVLRTSARTRSSHKSPGALDPDLARQECAAHFRSRDPNARPIGPAQCDDRRRPQGGAQPQARLRRGREPPGVAERSGELRLGRRPPRRGDPVRRAHEGAAGLRLSRRGRRHARGHRQDPHAGSSIRSTAPPISCTAFRISRSRSRSSARARSSPD